MLSPGSSQEFYVFNNGAAGGNVERKWEVMFVGGDTCASDGVTRTLHRENLL
jgi:hypothetical protein